MMFRNNDWSRAFLADVGQYAYMPPNELKEKMLPVGFSAVFMSNLEHPPPPLPFPLSYAVMKHKDFRFDSIENSLVD
jgi:hypothetical protein